jgi:hypothetical protein
VNWGGQIPFSGKKYSLGVNPWFEELVSHVLKREEDGI